MESLQGEFLVASPHLGDPNFYRSVVLILRHDEQGALGLVMNRPTNNTVASVWKLLGLKNCECDEPIYMGGPVSGPLMAVHRSKVLSQGMIVPGVYFTSERNSIHRLVVHAKKEFRIFTSYSGWGAGQLEAELAAGGWFRTGATRDQVFYHGEDQWKELLQVIADDIIAPALHEAQVPGDPTWN